MFKTKTYEQKLKERRTKIRKVLAEDLDYIKEELEDLKKNPENIFYLQSYEQYVSEGLAELQEIEDSLRRLKGAEAV